MKMLDSKVTCQKWRQLIQKAMGRKHVKRWREIMLDLLCVDIGIKPALLWDYATLSEQSMEFLLTEAKQDNLLINSLRLVVIESDMVILKEKYFKEDCGSDIADDDGKKDNNSNHQSIENFKGGNPENSVKSENKNGNDPDVTYSITDLTDVRFVDVTCNLKQPKMADFQMVEKTTQIYSSIVQGANKVNVRDSIFNPTSLFGLMLGYPIVYWYDMNIETGSNCLSYQPIRVFKLTGSLGESLWENLGMKSHSVYSFSVPESVLGQVRNFVFEWKERILKEKSWGLLFDDLRFEEEIKCLPCVCL